jgi:hypothetical protein
MGIRFLATSGEERGRMVCSGYRHAAPIGPASCAEAYPVNRLWPPLFLLGWLPGFHRFFGSHGIYRAWTYVSGLPLYSALAPGGSPTNVLCTQFTDNYTDNLKYPVGRTKSSKHQQLGGTSMSQTGHYLFLMKLAHPFHKARCGRGASSISGWVSD